MKKGLDDLTIFDVSPLFGVDIKKEALKAIKEIEDIDKKKQVDFKKLKQPINPYKK